MNYIVKFVNIVLFEIINFYWKKILKKLSLGFTNSFIFLKSIFNKFQLEGGLIEYSNNNSNGFCNKWSLSINYNDGIPIINIDKIYIFLNITDIPYFLKQNNSGLVKYTSNYNSLILGIIDEILKELSNRLILTINKIQIETKVNGLDYCFSIRNIITKKVDNEIITEIKRIKLNNLTICKQVFIKNNEAIISYLGIRLETILYIIELNKILNRYKQLFSTNTGQLFAISIEKTDIKINKNKCLIGEINNLVIKESILLEKCEFWIGNKTIKILEINNLAYNNYIDIDELRLEIGNRRQRLLKNLLENIVEILKEHFPKKPMESPILKPMIKPIYPNIPNMEPLTLVSNYLENIDEDLLGSVIETREDVCENIPNFLIINNLYLTIYIGKNKENNWSANRFIVKKLVDNFVINCDVIEIDNLDYEIKTKELKYRSIGNSIKFEPGIIIGRAVKSGSELDIESFKIFYKFFSYLGESINRIETIVINDEKKINTSLKSIEFANMKMIISYNPNVVRFYEILLGNYSEIVNLCNIDNMELYFSEFKVFRPYNFIEFLKKYLNHLIGEIRNRNWETIITNSPFKSIHSTGKFVMNIPDVYNRIMRIIS